MNSELLKDLDNAVTQFNSTVGALAKIQTINDSMEVAMREMSSCEEKILNSCKTIEESSNNVNEQAASFSESNEALRISLGKDVRSLSETVSLYAANAEKAINELRIQESSNSREIRESISELTTTLNNMGSSLTNSISVVQHLLEESEKKRENNKKILLTTTGFALVGMILALVGLFF